MRQAAPCRRLAAGEVLFHQGDPCDAIFEVEAGRVQLVRHDSGGHRLVLFNAGPGEGLAEAALFSAHYHCDAIATRAAAVRVHAADRVRAVLRDDPATASRFMAALAGQVQSLRARIELRNIRSARARVLHYLALAAGPRGRTVSITGTLKDFGEEIGLTHEALYRTLAALEADGTIRRRGRTISLDIRPDV